MRTVEGRTTDRWTDVALLLMRLALGWVFMYHGVGKLFGYADQGGLSGTSKYFDYLHIHPSGLWALLAALLEFFGGLGMVAGLLVRVAGVLLFVEMTLAFFIANFTCCMLPSPNSKAGDGAQINIALGVLSLAVALMGAGWYSLDRVLGTDRLLGIGGKVTRPDRTGDRT